MEQKSDINQQFHHSEHHSHSYHHRHHHSGHRSHRHRRHKKSFSQERQSQNSREITFMLMCAAGVIVLMLILIPLLANFMETL